MKKFLPLLLVLIMAISLAACGSAKPAAQAAATPEVQATATPAAESATSEATAAPAAAEQPASFATEVSGYTVPAFEITINGVAVNQEMMKDTPVYTVQTYSVNSTGTESTNTYIGYKMKDLCAVAGLTENYIWMEATATDGYAMELTGEIILNDTTLLALTKNDKNFSEGPWFAPCESQTSGDYLKNCTSILVNTTEEKP